MSENTSETESKRTVYFCAAAKYQSVGNHKVPPVHDYNNNVNTYLIPISIFLWYVLHESSWDVSTT